jgi:ribonuclease E
MSAGVNAAMKKYQNTEILHQDGDGDDDILFIKGDSDNEEDNVVLVMKDSSEDSDDDEDDEDDDDDEDDEEDEDDQEDEDDEDEAE